MMTLVIAAAVAAQLAPPANPHGQMTPAPHQQQNANDCCKDCCKDMADKQNGHGAERGGEGAGHGAHAK
jgi:hypothetical protein